LPPALSRFALTPLTLAQLSPKSKTYWVDTAEGIMALAALLENERGLGHALLRQQSSRYNLILGLDVESRPSFQAGVRNRASILQVPPFSSHFQVLYIRVCVDG
jgi:hypothetical protein